MNEILEQIVEYVRGAWRFRRYALIVAWVVALVGWLAIFALPDTYRANTRIFVEAETSLAPALPGQPVEERISAQLALVRQSLLAGPQLESVAAEVGLLDLRTATPQQRLRVVMDMRDRIDLTMTNAAGPESEGRNSGGTVYALQYSDALRDRALKVIDILKNRFIESTLGGGRTEGAATQRFLEDQIRDYEQRLRTAEDKLAAFKRENVGLLSTEQGGYFQRLQNAMEAVDKTQSALAVATSRREELQRQLRGEAPLAAASAPATPGSGPAAGGGDTLSRIRETQARLDELLLRFTDKHPDVVAAREALEQLKQRRELELEGLRRGDPRAAASSGASANPVYQSIQLASNQADVEIASLRRELSGHQNTVAGLRQKLDTMPQVEAEYTRLNRDYDVNKANYNALLQQLEKLRFRDDATSTGAAIRFDVIEPPNAPFKPTSPPRILLVLAVLVVSLGMGVGIALLLHLLNPVFSSAKSLTRLTGLPVLGSVSMAWVDQRDIQRRRSYWRYSAAVVMFVIAAVVVLQLNRMGVRLHPGA